MGRAIPASLSLVAIIVAVVVRIAAAFRDAASWLPPNAEFRCDFVARQVRVKSTYGLWVSAKEKQTMQDVLAGC